MLDKSDRIGAMAVANGDTTVRTLKMANEQQKIGKEEHDRASCCNEYAEMCGNQRNEDGETVHECMSEEFTYLAHELFERILLRLPVSSSIRLASVSKSWYSSIRSSSLMKLGVARTHPFLYIWGLNPKSVLTLASVYDPILARWLLLKPPNTMKTPSSASCSLACTPSGTLVLYPSGVCSSESLLLNFATNPLNTDWSLLSAASKHFLFSPVVAAIDMNEDSACSSSSSFVVFVLGELRSTHTVQIYNSSSDSWDVCGGNMPALGPLGSFRFMGSFHLSWAVVERRVYIAHIHTGFITHFDMDTKSWSPPLKLESRHVQHFRLASTGRGLFALGLSVADEGNESAVKLLKVDEITMQCREVSQMPKHLWASFTHHFDRGTHPLFVFKYVRCTGAGNLMYVYSGSYFSKMVFCVCDIEDGYRWQQLPPLPADLKQLDVRSECCSFQLMPEVCLKTQFDHHV
ncbi:hypothetical protein KP509_02G045900 [Ceratopteris richardii]|nr:hypothetical protein KP509_02G045900 [Ceratopteris richardii]KAH7443681.1 hypothetical protein KP509_02G045900 [Ceratopteris richardii]